MDKRSITCVLHADFTKIHFHKLTSTILVISFVSSWYQYLVKPGLSFKYFIFTILHNILVLNLQTFQVLLERIGMLNKSVCVNIFQQMTISGKKSTKEVIEMQY